MYNFDQFQIAAMSTIEHLRTETAEMGAEQLVAHLIRSAYPGRTVVTASLRARSLVVLRMVADIEPMTPVVFCQPTRLYPESLAFRAELVRRLGLGDVAVSTGREPEVLSSDRDHVECMWADDPMGGGQVHEMVHLNETLADFDCWISAVYHVPKHPRDRQRIVRDGRLVRVDPLVDWSDDQVRTYLKARDLSYHPRARARAVPLAPAEEPAPVYCY